MKKKKIFFALIVCMLFFLYGNFELKSPASFASGGEEIFSKDTEKLEFSLRWNGIIGGKSTIDFEKIPLPDLEQKSYFFQSQLKTVGLADIFFRIRNEYSTLAILDSKEILPIWWEVKQQEKNYKYEEKTDFVELLAKEPGLQNPLSALFLIRLKKWEVSESVIVPVLVQKKIYPIKVQAVSKEPLKIYGKTFDTIVIDVATQDVTLGISSTKISDIKIWLTDDERKLPILMKANTAVGPITVLLDNREELLE
ncbi:MAG: DUF3108 domain-containing protein [Candidatus Omnitrophica bacterium]|nr:DUF3108 domain-containing protein [Candidatus Omnitrophota bacterium]MBU1047801.1 DUF3108 domain-containing protein [Candidatus Omnitrophota bacterium]MBU1631088.1 DUF3108 domain-containing protein [Candidatus Omnitrophota bacterium]MBU1767148.1 DUF3108 domain-containing protein [Candidatus Omnitrophota bacterium]MBU1889355.1 DUF3108 domain-containing protein [Candidatus Omnitrophota bacterium]